jgi:hypothetical protein
VTRNTYTMMVEDAFRFADGTTLFLGTVQPEQPHLVPAAAEVQVNGHTIASVNLTEERMPGPASRGRRSLMTPDAVDHEAIVRGHCVLICRR